MENAALNALFARAEIFNKFEELGSQLNPEEAEIASHYLENLIKTRPVRAQLTCPESEQFFGPGLAASLKIPQSEQFEPGLHNLNFQEPGLHAPELSDTNCEYCAAGNTRLQDFAGYYHIINLEDGYKASRNCEVVNAQN